MNPLDQYYYHDYVLSIPDMVYPPEEDSALLADELERYLSPSEKVWDLGTGSGLLAIVARSFTPSVIASDINPYAIAALQNNCQANKIPACIPTFIGSFDAPLKKSCRFSRILFNAPYLPSSSLTSKPRKAWIDYAWDGGIDGIQTVGCFLEMLPHRLEEGGVALLALSETKTKEWLVSASAKNGLQAKTLQRKHFFYETLIIAEITRIE